MAKKKYVWVEVNLGNTPVRIFSARTKMIEAMSQAVSLIQMPRADAVSAIRHQCWLRSEGHCERCGVTVTEENGHMHEKVFRSQGGEISLDNSIFICYPCHMGAADCFHK